MSSKRLTTATSHTRTNNSYLHCDNCNKDIPCGRFIKHKLTNHFDELFLANHTVANSPAKHNRASLNKVRGALELVTKEDVFYCCLVCNVGIKREDLCIKNHFCDENNHTKDHLAACKQLKERIEHPESYVPPKRTRSKKQPGQSVETPIASPTPTEPLPVREIVRTSLTEEQQDDLLSILADANIDYNKQAKKLILADYANDLLKKTLQAATEQAERDNKVIAMMREKLRTICPDTDCPRHFDIQEEMIVRDATVSNTSYMHIMDKLNTKIMNKSDDIILDDKHKSNIIEKNVDLLRSVGVSEDTLDLYI